MLRYKQYNCRCRCTLCIIVHQRRTCLLHCGSLQDKYFAVGDWLGLKGELLCVPQ
jgi:hypothetical protein